MNKNKRQKGFTLVELIIVLAIFSIILTLVMSFIDPVAKLMSRTSIKERTAAYVDNISEYVDNSVHYAKYIRVFNGGYCDTADESVQITGADSNAKDRAMVKNFVDYYLNGVVDSKGDFVTGKVHILKLINTDGDGLKSGHIYETVLDFQAGETFMTRNAGVENEITIAEPKVPNIAANSVYDREVINPEHFVDYNYYYNIGFCNLVPIPDLAERCPSLSAERLSYYSRLVPMLDNEGNELEVDESTGRNLTINVVAYKNVPGEVFKEDTEYKIDESTSKNITVFKSPCRMSTSSMALINALKANEEGYISNFRLKRKIEDGSPQLTDGGKRQFEKIEKVDEGNTFHIMNPASAANDNIYIVYILPNEINDSNIIYK